MNRYDQMNWGQLQLPSLQEMAFVPGIKRQQHDSALANLEKYRSDLLKMDPHRKYQEEALRLQNEMNFELDNAAEQLNKQGFTSGTTSDVLRLNRRVNDLMAPTGKAGQINAHKVALNETYKNYLEESIKAGNSPEIAKYHAEQALSKHLNEDPLYDEQGNIVPFNINAAPTYVDFNKFVMDAAKEAKLSEEHWSKAISYLTKDNENNRYVLNEKAKGLTADNYKALQAVRDYVNNTLADTSSPLRRSVDYNLRDLENLKVLGQNATSIFETSKTGITDSSSAKTSVDWASQEDIGGSKLLVNNEVYSPANFTNEKYSNNEIRLNDLKSKSNLSLEEQSELRNLEDFQNNVKKELQNNEYYSITLQSRINNLKEKYNLEFDPNLVQEVETISSDGQTTTKKLYIGNKPMTHAQELKYNKYKGELRSIEKEMRDIENINTKEANIKYNGYQLVPTTPKEETSVNLMNKAFETALKANPKNLLNYTNIESVDTEDGVRNGKNLDIEDKEKIVKLFNNTSNGSLKIISYIPKGFSGKPEYIVEIDTKENNEVDLNRWFRSEEGSGKLGGGKPVRLKLSYDVTKGDVLNNANGYIQEYLSNKGDVDPETGLPQGYHLALDMKVNADKSKLNTQFAKGKKTWGNIVNEDTDFTKLNPLVVKEIQNTLKTKYGLNNETSDEDLQKMLIKFMKEEGDKTIYLK